MTIDGKDGWEFVWVYFDTNWPSYEERLAMGDCDE